jgi:hypothetical protein
MQQMNFYCRSYCLLNLFRVPLCPSSGAREYYTSGCCFTAALLASKAAARKPDTQPATTHYTESLKTKHQIRQTATTCIILSSS